MSPLVLLQDKGVHPGPARARPSEQDEAGADIKVAAGAGGLHVLAPAALMFRCRRLGRPPLPSCKGGRRRRRATARIEPKLHGPQRATGMPAVSLVPRGESSPWGPSSPTSQANPNTIQTDCKRFYGFLGPYIHSCGESVGPDEPDQKRRVPTQGRPSERPGCRRQGARRGRPTGRSKPPAPTAPQPAPKARAFVAG